MLKDRPGRDRAASFRLYFISIPLGDAKFVTKEGRSAGQPLILIRIDYENNQMLFLHAYWLQAPPPSPL